MKKLMPKVFTLILILTIVMTASVSAQTPRPAQKTLTESGIKLASVYQTVDLKKAIRSSDGLLSLIVELSDPALATYSGGIQGLAPTSPASTGRRLDVTSAASVAYLAFLDGVQTNFRAVLTSQAPSARFDFSYKVALNGLAIKISDADVNALLKMPGVLRVFPDQIRTKTMDASLPLINAAAAWAKLGGKSSAGAGIKVAVVDSGLRPNNPMFSGTNFSMPFGYPKGFCVTNPADPNFQCNNKVIAARYFYDHSLDATTHPDELGPLGQTPLGLDGHGSHTAGTSAGNEVTIPAGALVPTDTVISGVAPAAYLMVYKALFETDDLSTAQGTDAMLTAALDAALADGADVINNSWGGGAGGDPRGSVYNDLIHNISAAGTTVVFSAGNDGPDSQTIGCPGCVEDAITVAASTTNRHYAPVFSVTGPGAIDASLQNIEIRPGDGPALDADMAKGLVAAVDIDVNNAEGCDPFPALSMDDKIALIQRGTCNFSVKIDNAADAGAKAALIYNNFTNANEYINMATGTSTIPAAHMLQADGDAVVTFITNNPTAAGTWFLNNVRFSDAPDVLASFSSVGPNGDPNVLKPDLTAPGVNIVSAYSHYFDGDSDPVYGEISGTSMSAPHVTGSAALMIQMHPDWTPAEIKTALTSTAVQTLMQPDGVTPADPFNMGAGRIDLDRASNASAVFNKPSFANGNCILTCSWTNTIKNVTGATLTYNADVDTDAALGVTVSPATFTLPPGLTGEFTVQADVSTATVGDWYFGSVTWTATSGSYPDAYMPMAVSPGDASDANALDKSVDKAVAVPGDSLNYTITVRNPNTFATTYYLMDVLPDNLEYTSMTDPVASKGTADYDPGTKTITATIPLDPASASITRTDFGGYFDISSIGATPRNPICGECDDAIINFGLQSPFTYFGESYSVMGVSTNGYLVAGGDASATGTVQNMPNPAGPNNVIAPLWADLDLAGGSGGGGNLYFAQVNFVSGDSYYVAQWSNAQQYGAAGTTYSVQVWVPTTATGGPISYSYDTAIPVSTFPLSIGFENSTGAIGAMQYFFDGVIPTGALPDPAVPAIRDVILTSALDTATVTYTGAPILPAALAIDNRVINNLVQATNSEDAEVNEALAVTLFQPPQYYLPIIGKQ